MKNKGIVILSTALLWAVIIIVSSLTLRGTEYNSPILLIHGVGSAGCIILLGGLSEKSKNQHF